MRAHLRINQVSSLDPLISGGTVRKRLLLLTIAVLCLGKFASADTFITSGSRASGFTTDAIDWGQLGAPGTLVTTPALVTSLGGTNSALAGNINGSQFVTAQEGTNWIGNFDFGENLVWTGNSNFGFGGLGPFDMVLANPVGGIGFGIQADHYGPFVATVTVFDPLGNTLTTLTFNGVSNGLENGSNLFIGIQDKTAVNIGAIEISTVSPSDPGQFNNDFALDAVSFNYTTPEPGSLALLGSALIGVAGLFGRKLGR